MSEPSIFVNRRHLSMFIAIAEAGSMHRAAKEIGTTAQSIAKALDRYEEDVSTRLFVRDQYPGAYPTPLGNIAVSQARVILKSMDDADRTFLQARDALNMFGPGKW